MTDQEINGAIAQACGWQEVFRDRSGGLQGFPPGKLVSYDVPNFCGSLDAMQAALDTLDPDQWAKYRQILFPIAAGKHCGDFEERLAPALPAAYTRGRAYFCSRPHQQAEAFLRVHGAWKEGDL